MSRGGLQEKRWPEQYIICFINTIKPSDSCTSMSEVLGLMFKIVTIYCSGGKHLSKQASWATSLATGTAILYIKKWKTKEKQQISASGILFFFFLLFCIVLISKMMTIECITMPQTTTRFTVFFLIYYMIIFIIMLSFLFIFVISLGYYQCCKTIHRSRRGDLNALTHQE